MSERPKITRNPEILRRFVDSLAKNCKCGNHDALSNILNCPNAQAVVEDPLILNRLEAARVRAERNRGR